MLPFASQECLPSALVVCTAVNRRSSLNRFGTASAVCNYQDYFYLFLSRLNTLGPAAIRKYRKLLVVYYPQSESTVGTLFNCTGVFGSISGFRQGFPHATAPDVHALRAETSGVR